MHPAVYYVIRVQSLSGDEQARRGAKWSHAQTHTVRSVQTHADISVKRVDDTK